MPPTTKWLLAFQACNACNFTIALGAPLVLAARHIGATEFHIGIMNALPVLLIALQLLATNLVDRLGYRRLMLMGWSARSFMLLLIAPLPMLTGIVPPWVLILGMIIPIMGFSAIRGFASGAWLPWLTAVLPPEQRGLYLGKEQRTMNVSGLATLLLCGFFLGGNPAGWKFSTMFVVAWAAGMMSVYFLRNTADTPPTANENQPHRSLAQVWEAIVRIWGHKAFRRTTSFVSLYTIALSSIPVFLVLFVKEELGYTDGQVLKMQAATTLGVLATAVYWGQLSDRSGSRPLLRLSDLGMLAILAYWLGAALGFYRPALIEIISAYGLWGVFSAAHAVAQTRLVLSCSPKDELIVGTAFFQVIVALFGGVAPIFFGGALEWLRHPADGGAGLGRIAFAIIFGIALILGLLSQILLSRVPESAALATHRLVMQVVYDWPIKVLSGIASSGGSSRKP